MVYQGMNIGTHKPDLAELKRITHHLIDIKTPLEVFSAAGFNQACAELIPMILARGKQPLIVGGTMLYFKALYQGLSLPVSSDPEIRKALFLQAQEQGWAALYQQLKDLDPKAAAQINCNDQHRIARALEIHRLSGQKPSSFWQPEKASNACPYPLKIRVLLPRDRQALHQKIALRFKKMLDLGLIEEVENLQKQWGLTADLPAMRTVGYRQVFAYLKGLCDKATMIEKAIVATRQLAKRQLTWIRSFGHIENIHYDYQD